MNKIQTVRWMGTVEGRGQAKEVLAHAGDAALVERGCPRWFVMKCPCGCAEELAVNLDVRAGPAWRLYSKGNKRTLYPSIWRNSGCRSHFIIWGDRILWVDDYDHYECSESDRALDGRVLDALTMDYRHFEEIAVSLNEIPWAVLASARRLTAQGLAVERFGEQWGAFRRANASMAPMPSEFEIPLW